MRYYGEIKWFGGFNSKKNKANDFGYINNIGDKELDYKDIYFHESAVLFDVKLVKTGLLVSFEISINPVKAINVKLLADEMELTLLERCLGSKYPYIWLSVINNISKQVPLKDGIAMVEIKLSRINLGASIKLVEYLPHEYFLNSNLIFDCLDKKTKEVVLKEILKIKRDKEEKEFISLLEDYIDKDKLDGKYSVNPPTFFLSII